MKALPAKRGGMGFVPASVEDAEFVFLNIPGPIPHRMIPVKLMNSGKIETHPMWDWNGDVENPTLVPSILSNNGTDRCHTFVTNGKVQFLADCSHEFAGKEMDLLEVEPW